jgi:hypothetical protein
MCWGQAGVSTLLQAVVALQEFAAGKVRTAHEDACAHDLSGLGGSAHLLACVVVTAHLTDWAKQRMAVQHCNSWGIRALFWHQECCPTFLQDTSVMKL